MANPSSHTSALRSSPFLTFEERQQAALDAAGPTITTSDPRALLQIALGAGDEEPVAALFEVIAAHLEVYRRRVDSRAEDIALFHVEQLARVGARLARIAATTREAER